MKIQWDGFKKQPRSQASLKIIQVKEMEAVAGLVYVKAFERISEIIFSSFFGKARIGCYYVSVPNKAECPKLDLVLPMLFALTKYIICLLSFFRVFLAFLLIVLL